jgi:hypothetical protein
MTLHAARLFGALSILAVGGVHLQQYAGADYSVIPTVGTLFLLNAIGAGVVGLGLLLPFRAVLGDRGGSLAVGMLAAAGVAIAVGSLVALFISETGTLFGFSEYGGFRSVIVVAVATEAAATLILTPLAVFGIARALGGSPSMDRQPRPAGRGAQAA